MTTSTLPFRSAADLDAERVDAVLRASGALAQGRVVDVTATPIGTGQMAASLRLALRYDGATDGPASLVVKLPSEDERSRTTGRVLRAYEVEVGFYRHLVDGVGVRAPRCLLAEIDLESHDFVLLLEDLAPATAGDQLSGCSPDLAAAVLEEAVAFHAPRWGDPALADHEWLDRATPEHGEFTVAMVSSLYPGFLERYADRIDPDVRAGLDAGMAGMGGWWTPEPVARTLLHGDLRLDNLLIGPGGDEVWVVDWQTLVLGDGVADVSYFLGGNLSLEDRRAHEADLVRQYHQGLVAGGVEDLTWDECWRRYRRGAWHGVFLCVGASMLVEQTPRGDDMFMANLHHHVRHAVDLDALGAIGVPA